MTDRIGKVLPSKSQGDVMAQDIALNSGVHNNLTVLFHHLLHLFASTPAMRLLPNPRNSLLDSRHAPSREQPEDPITCAQLTDPLR